ncbi:MAG: hypothetical protein LUQ01_05875 [Methanolinea sp.]|nr:hypothetical protein [Methanolinea sp.]
MDKRISFVLVLGLVVSVVLFLLVDLYMAIIALILVIVLVMSLWIMQDSVLTPQIAVRLEEDAKSVLVKNKGNAPALHIHMALVPMNLEFDLPALKDEEQKSFPLGQMVNEVKAVVTYQNERGVNFSGTFHLSSLGPDEDDLLKPSFPLFGWK